MAKFINKSGLEFADISSEAWRTYFFPHNDVLCGIKIDKPLLLHVSKSGGHRLFDADGISHYIPSGWIHLVWEAKKGSANFVK